MTMKKLWMLAVILSTALWTVSCADMADNPVPAPTPTPVTPDEPASAVDKGTWTLDDSYVDKSYAPGDNFFMYRNGTWWKSATPYYLFKEGFLADVERAWEKKAASFNNPVLQQLNNDVKNIDNTSAEADAFLKNVIAESGLMTATTLEEAWRAVGKQALMGAATMVELESFSREGKIRLALGVRDPEILGEEKTDMGGLGGLDFNYEPTSSRYNNPEFIRSLAPLKRSGTRSLSAERWPMLVAIVEAMGIDPATVYLPDEMENVNGPFDEEVKAKINLMLSALEKMQKLTLPEFQQAAMSYLTPDSAFVSNDAMIAINLKILDQAEKSDDESAEPKEISAKSAVSVLSEKYLAYNNSKVLADNYVTPGMKQRGREIADELIKVFAQRIQDNSWLSEASKKNALEKLNNMTVNIAAPDKWIDEGLPDLNGSKTFLEDVYRVRQAALRFVKALNGMDAKEASFNAIIAEHDTPLTTFNAFYHSNYNSMNIYPCWLDEPFLSPNYNQAINYGSFEVMGHEMTHGFDTNGAKFNAQGDYGPIFANDADAQEFQRRADLLTQWYATLDLLPEEMPGVKANAAATITEDIADLGGFEIAYQAYCNRLKADGFTGDQLKLQQQRFYLIYTEHYRSKYTANHVNYVAFGKDNPEGPDSHSMDKERVNGLLPNTDAWYDLFDIKPGQALYRAPADRVHIW